MTRSDLALQSAILAQLSDGPKLSKQIASALQRDPGGVESSLRGLRRQGRVTMLRPKAGYPAGMWKLT